MTDELFDFKIWYLTYDGEGDDGEESGDDGGGGDDESGDESGSGGKTYTEEDINRIVQKRTSKARAAQRKALERLENLEKNLKMTNEEREELEQEIETLRKQTLSAEEIAKREKKKAAEQYEAKLSEAEKSAQRWQSQYNDLRINREISDAAREFGVTAQGVPFLESFLKPSTGLVEVKDDETGEVKGLDAVVDFEDIGEDDKPVKVQMSVRDTVKRMKELPDKYGHLFSAPNSGGVGGSSGSGDSKSKSGYRPGMTPEEYAKLRKENPEAIYG